MTTQAEFFSFVTANNVSFHVRLDSIVKVMDMGSKLAFFANGETYELTKLEDKQRLLESLGLNPTPMPIRSR